MKLRNILIVTFMLIPWVSYSQIGQHVSAGLENDAEYMQLLNIERELSLKKDSLNRVITLLREEFRTGNGDRDEFSARILQLEKELFEVSGRVDETAAKLGTIRESSGIVNLQNGDMIDAVIQADTLPEAAKQSANLTVHEAFRELLPERDYAALIRAQSQEVRVADMARRYIMNYTDIEEIAAAYSEVDDAVPADSIYTLYVTLDRENKMVADSLGNAWHDIYDSKLFAYNYLLQSRNQARVLTRLEALGRDARDEIADRRGDNASEELSEYFAQKNHVLEYEKAVAEMLDQTVAADSLNRAAKALGNFKRQLPKIDLEEKYFIDYADVSFRSPAIYTTSNPIPETMVYRRGVVYRIRMGSYPAKQAVSVFKGAYPLGYVNESGKWDYYAGGFADLDKAKTALEDVVKRGFRGARIVVWNDGEALTLDDKPVEGKVYRVEISGAKDGLPDAVREAIVHAGGGIDISISGDLFIASPFPTALEAETVANAARKAGAVYKANPPLSIRTKIR